MTAGGQWLRYAAAVVGYIGLAMLTKRFLTWTYGPTYFILTLEVLPRLLRRGGNYWTSRRRPSPVQAPELTPVPEG